MKYKRDCINIDLDKYTGKPLSDNEKLILERYNFIYDNRFFNYYFKQDLPQDVLNNLFYKKSLLKILLEKEEFASYFWPKVIKNNTIPEEILEMYFDQILKHVSGQDLIKYQNIPDYLKYKYNL